MLPARDAIAPGIPHLAKKRRFARTVRENLVETDTIERLQSHLRELVGRQLIILALCARDAGAVIDIQGRDLEATEIHTGCDATSGFNNPIQADTRHG